MVPKRQERVTDTTKTRTTATSNIPLREQGTQTTRAGYEIPAPTREEFESLLSRAAKKRPQEPSSERD